MPSKNKGESGTRPNRIRFIMLDADISDGNLTELTQAITSALRPAPAQGRLLQAPVTPMPRVIQAGNGHASDETIEDGAGLAEEATVGEAAPSNTKTTTRHAPPQPDYLHDLDPQSEFRDYAAKRPQSKHTRRYLLAAAWLKEYKNMDTINIHQIYTCYKTASWPTNIKDWDANFRSLVKQEWMRRTATGAYAINPLGEAALAEA